MKALKATRLYTEEYALGHCPVCAEEIKGKITVEAHLDPKPRIEKGGTQMFATPTVTVGATTRIRSLEFSHKCEVRAVPSDDEAAPADTPNTEDGDGVAEPDDGGPSSE